MGTIALGLVSMAAMSVAARKMDDRMDLFSWVRSGNGVQIVRIEKRLARPSEPGQEAFTLEVRTVETLWGKPGESLRRYDVVQAASPTARLKFPDPVWGRVRIEPGTQVLLVTDNGSGKGPVWVEEIGRSDDPVLVAVRDILDQERANGGEQARAARYLGWLKEPSAVYRLYATAAVAELALPDATMRGGIVGALARELEGERNAYLCLSLGITIWNKLLPRASPQEQVLIVNAMLRAIEHLAEPDRELLVDRLADADPRTLALPGVRRSSPEALRSLQQRRAREKTEAGRAHLESVIDALR